ncbi:hypothetical protein DRW07_06495 [Alteromonas sediminis]|uniref:Uncharacterized protein n=1 Tax=Alteromonas sediminis TaxID=2259342 RepID=A0A3N5Y0Y1_9ALTE|nr:hypothetical protein [Alteromonas sediminis]RPJ67182.1 hypothetical protein DRW07_06495 [Alteromonas sediminis]
MKQLSKIIAFTALVSLTTTVQASNESSLTLTEMTESAIASMNSELNAKLEQTIQREAKKAMTEQLAVARTAIFIASVSNSRTTDKMVIKGE